MATMLDQPAKQSGASSQPWQGDPASLDRPAYDQSSTRGKAFDPRSLTINTGTAADTESGNDDEEEEAEMSQAMRAAQAGYALDDLPRTPPPGYQQPYPMTPRPDPMAEVNQMVQARIDSARPEIAANAEATHGAARTAGLRIVGGITGSGRNASGTRPRVVGSAMSQEDWDAQQPKNDPFRNGFFHRDAPGEGGAPPSSVPSSRFLNLPREMPTTQMADGSRVVVGDYGVGSSRTLPVGAPSYAGDGPPPAPVAQPSGIASSMGTAMGGGAPIGAAVASTVAPSINRSFPQLSPVPAAPGTPGALASLPRPMPIAMRPSQRMSAQTAVAADGLNLPRVPRPTSVPSTPAAPAVAAPAITNGLGYSNPNPVVTPTTDASLGIRPKSLAQVLNPGAGAVAGMVGVAARQAAGGAGRWLQRQLKLKPLPVLTQRVN